MFLDTVHRKRFITSMRLWVKVTIVFGHCSQEMFRLKPSPTLSRLFQLYQDSNLKILKLLSRWVSMLLSLKVSITDKDREWHWQRRPRVSSMLLMARTMLAALSDTANLLHLSQIGIPSTIFSNLTVIFSPVCLPWNGLTLMAHTFKNLIGMLLHIWHIWAMIRIMSATVSKIFSSNRPFL